MCDYLVRGLAAQGKVRAVAVRLNNTVREYQHRHGAFPTATAALGRLMVSAAVMSSTLKNGDKVTLQIVGNGPFGRLVADANWLGDLRGYVTNPHVRIPPRVDGKLDVAAGVGKTGMLYVIRDMGLKEPYYGSSSLISGEIAEDVAYYFAVSEQVPSVFAAGVLVARNGIPSNAGGYLLQLMPGADEEVITFLERRVSQVPSITAMLDSGLSPEDILYELVDDLDFQLVGERKSLRFQCRCSKERLAGILLSMGEQELEELIRQGQAEVTCHFCAERYHFSREELEELLANAKGEE